MQATFKERIKSEVANVMDHPALAAQQRPICAAGMSCTVYTVDEQHVDHNLLLSS